MTISLRPGGLGAEAPALVFRPARRATVLCGRVGDCCREDCPFHSARRRPGLCCSHAGGPACRSGLSRAGRAAGPCPRFREAPRSMQLGLSSSVAASGHPIPTNHASLMHAGVLYQKPGGGARRGHKNPPNEGADPRRRMEAGGTPGWVRGQGFEPQLSAPKAGVLP